MCGERERELDLTGVTGAGISGTPGWGALAFAGGIPWTVRF